MAIASTEAAYCLADLRQIALNLSAKTISTHKANLMQKMGLHNQSELIRYAIKHGVTEPLEP